MTGYVWDALAPFSISLCGVGLVMMYSRRVGLLDIPNHRSSHSIPTPRGGGIALVLAILLVAVYELTQLQHTRTSGFAVLLGAVVALAWVGWLDDHGSMRVRVRLGVHLLCGAAVALLVNQVAPLPGPANIPWLVWWVFWTVASINVVNFMDGIDGMIASQGIVYGVFLFALLFPINIPSRFALILAGACLGFLVWNWAPARIFMGDVGSGPLGLFVVIGGALALEGSRPALVFVPLFPLFLDALLTLIIRFRRGEKLTDAHRSHLYQRLANGGWGHATVTSIYALAAGLGALVALGLRNAPGIQMTVGIAAYALTVLGAWRFLHLRFLEPIGAWTIASNSGDRSRFPDDEWGNN
jgi:UDP-N-acetylmuramyl pentapeptide phosphotransferase/UDP-N-acetylglucosamine-1-phosphate transferase